MKVAQAFKMAIDAIWSNKVRSLLTVLGVVIGMFAVIILITLGQGAGNSINSQFNELGSNMIQVMITTRRNFNIPQKEIMALQGKDGIQYVCPYVQGSSVTVKAGTEDYATTVVGATTGYMPMRNMKVDFGRMISDEDMANRLNVMIIGIDVADELFGIHDESILGNTVTMLGRKFTIVGIQEKKGSSLGGSEDDHVIIPFSTAQRLLKVRTPYIYIFGASSDKTVDMAQTAVTDYFNSKFKDRDDFKVFNQAELLGQLNQAMGTITGMLAGIAAISLLVGGIGIMNIMLVSVTERTREIGIRKAIGAKHRDIMIQFLIESAVISMIGGVIALVFGYGVTALLEKLLNMEMSITGGVIALSLGFSAGVGIIFGIYPASRAAKLNPIAALRHE